MVCRCSSRSSCWKVLAFQLGHRGINNRRIRRDTSSSSSLYYKEPSPPPPEDITTSSGDNNNNFNVWSVLANTERWISDTLDKSNSAEVARRQQPPPQPQQQQQQEQKKENKLHFADEKKAAVPVPPNNNNNNNDNPYARKEISYVCETNTDLVSVVGGIFRRVREARELGEHHGRKVMIEITEQQAMGKYDVVWVVGCVHYRVSVRLSQPVSISLMPLSPISLGKCFYYTHIIYYPYIQAIPCPYPPPCDKPM